MKYSQFLTMIRKNKLYIFTISDIARYFPNSAKKTIQNQIQLWREKGSILRLKRGLYQIKFPEGGPNISDLYISNRLYEPSYVSLETALSFYSLIPEVAIGVTSITTRQTKLFKNKFGSFRYRSCKKEAYCGYKIMVYEGSQVCIAEKEKALVDFIYFKNRYGEEISAAAERLDNEMLKKLSWNKIFRYARIYNKETLKITKRIRKEIL